MKINGDHWHFVLPARVIMACNYVYCNQICRIKDRKYNGDIQLKYNGDVSLYNCNGHHAWCQSISPTCQCHDQTCKISNDLMLSKNVARENATFFMSCYNLNLKAGPNAWGKWPHFVSNGPSRPSWESDHISCLTGASTQLTFVVRCLDLLK